MEKKNCTFSSTFKYIRT